MKIKDTFQRRSKEKCVERGPMELENRTVVD